MCGIIGWIGKPDSQLASKMRDIISHRGPDDAGEWWDPDRGAWLGHRRLSILDLTPEGHQPMLSPSHRYVISYNGEVFNFLSLREELEGQGFRFRGHSDTEVILMPGVWRRLLKSLSGCLLWVCMISMKMLCGLSGIGWELNHCITHAALVRLPLLLNLMLLNSFRG